MRQAVVALGGNVGDVPAAFVRALELLQDDHTRIVVVSRLYHSVPLDLPGPLPLARARREAGNYTNAACRLVTRLGPRRLLERLHKIEQALGRQRSSPWAPRTIDLDLICYEQKIMQSNKLTLPHKGLPFRAFVLAPCQDIGVEYPWPHLPISVTELLLGGQDAARGLLHRQLSWRPS